MAVRIVQLTDLHLFRDSTGMLRGVPTLETFREVLDEVHEHEPDLLVFSGDLAEDELPETYAILGEMLQPWRGRFRLLPGNHDNLSGLRAAFPDLFSRDHDHLTFECTLDGWSIIGLDTHVPGQVAGEISDAQLGWLARTLGLRAGMPVLVFLHHPPTQVEMPWLSRHLLLEPERLFEVLDGHGRVQAISAGHVHHAFESRRNGVRLLTTPSTCIQFDRGTPTAMPDVPPGYRVFDLDGGSLSTEVHYLPAVRYVPHE